MVKYIIKQTYIDNLKKYDIYQFDVIFTYKISLYPLTATMKAKRVLLPQVGKS